MKNWWRLNKELKKWKNWLNLKLIALNNKKNKINC